MSTILETLKKLEEDKRLLNRHLDLKDMVLQEDQKGPVEKKLALSRNNILVLVFLGTLIGVALMWEFKSAKVTATPQFAQEPLADSQSSREKSRPEATTVGIPLSNIPDREHRQNPAKKKDPPQVMETPALETRRPVAEPLPLEVNEIRDLIEAAKLSAEQPDYSLESSARGISIPGLKVKGIIFFSPGSPSNHIFVSTPTRNNQKIRIGDTVHSATLRQIESNSTVFSYQGETIHLRIGE